MSRNRIGTRRALRFKPSTHGGIFLPNVGWAADLGRVNVSSLPNLTYNSGGTVTLNPGDPGTSRTNPLKANHLLVTNNTTLYAGTSSCLFIWVNTFQIDSGSTCIATDTSVGNPNGGDGRSGSCVSNIGGNGGDGASGGGGGSVGLGPGIGGDGTNGTGGVPTGGGTPGAGGTGTGTTYNTGPFTFPIGGTDSAGNPSSGPWGKGGDGATVNNSGTYGGGGGGAGGGLYTSISNEVIDISGNCQGGNSGISDSSGCCTNFVTPSIAGGGGVQAHMSKKWPGFPGGNFNLQGGFSNDDANSGGTGTIMTYEINHDGTLILASYSDTTISWDHL